MQMHTCKSDNSVSLSPPVCRFLAPSATGVAALADPSLTELEQENGPHVLKT